ncbi:MAG: hypothetical protein Roseis2KO_51340 [Roseivirga sp.]
MKKIKNTTVTSPFAMLTAMLVCMLLFMVSGCAREKTPKVPAEVSHYGVLREIMMEQKIEANADLADLRDLPDLYALGALEGLAGEILILDSQPFNGIASQGELSFDKTFDRKATLLVSAQVPAWQELSLQLESVDLAQLQTIVRDAAKQLSISTEEAVPFMIKGELKQVDWHVINAAEAEAQNHDAYKKAGLQGESRDIKAELLGFYSEKHEGVFTHHGSYLHIHFMNADETEMGHVDELMIDGKVVLLFPETKRP